MRDKIQDAVKLAEWYATHKGSSATIRGAEMLSSAVLALYKQVQAKQAQIDNLMFEYCPGEMTKEQLEEWAMHQTVVDTPESLS